MNLKFIILFFIACNILALAFSFNCQSNDVVCGGQFNLAILSVFFNIDNSMDYAANSGISLTDDFSTATSGITKPETSAVSGTGIIGAFLDGLKMVGGILTLLTPFPIIIFINSLGFPFMLSIMILAPLFILYVLGLVEFVRGSSL